VTPINDVNDDLWPLQQAVAAFVMGNPSTNVVPFSIYRKLLIQSVQDEAQAAWKVRVPGKIGIAALVMQPSLRIVDVEVPGPQYEVVVVIRIFADPRVNNTGLQALGVGMATLRWLDGHIFEGMTEVHGDTKQDALRPNYDYAGLEVYDLQIKGPLPQDYLGQTQAPSITADNAGNVMLACGDAGATIYFTMDGSEPMPPANAGEATTAQVYSGPFAVASGTVVRVIAWNKVNLPSGTAMATITF
jgi:hypothetical protein